ncbi:MAG: succinylglutamate desuccinylase/aspartoacylase family protein [Nitrospirae bacterium]|nr:succinylglutamate desuccinylase/aspartoacylase family protein [Nitrospirota bacterium]
MLLSLDVCLAKTNHEVYFENTDYELHVYKIHGTDPGKTLLIIGGIQGDESGGYLSADLYADMALKKGSLIVVPRANFLSIIKHKRAINNDMNRRFAINSREYYEDKVVEILKALIDKSDYLLNLHEGSGFYSDTWESDLANPKRFGQSIIADTDVYKTDSGKVINLAGIAGEIVEKVNSNIKIDRHHFRFNNHKTFEKDTTHPEQRKSATYYALSTRGIPAFGIETSKEITDIEKKVRYQTMVINAFMDKFGIVPETPKIVLDPPKLKYMVLSVNGVDRLVHNNGEIKVQRGGQVKIVEIAANYKRGLSVEVKGLGTANAINKEFAINSPMKALAMKDGYKCGEIRISIDDEKTQQAQISKQKAFKYLILELNGVNHVLRDKERLNIIKGDHMKLLDIVVEGISANALTVNLLGFVGDKEHNTGEDRGYKINTAKDLMPRYSLNKEGKQYTVEIATGKSIMASVYIDIEEPKMDYIVLRQNKGWKRWYSNGELITASISDSLEVVDVKTNVNGNKGISVSLEKSAAKGNTDYSLPIGEAVTFDDRAFKEGGQYSLTIKREGIVIGKTNIKIGRPVASLDKVGN